MIDKNNLPIKLEAEFGNAVSLSQAVAVDDVLSQCEAAPHNEEAARELVKWCGRNSVAFLACGGKTKLHIGSRPTRYDLALSTRHLNAVIEHDEGNATVQAQSGISLEALNQSVGARAQFVPLDWQEQGAATLGGTVAANHFGATKLRYGAPRDLVVGLHAILSDGRHVKAGSKVVKNVSGYDLNKLFVGSFGSLGLITQVTIRLRPQDAQRKYWEKTYASLAEAEAVAQQILNGLFEPAILQIDMQGDRVLLRLRFDGGDAAVGAQLEKLPAGEQNAAQDSPSLSELELCAAMPITRAGAWAQTAGQMGASHVSWDYGLGVVRAQFKDAPENIVDVVDDLRAHAVRNEGYVVVERAPGGLKTADFVWGAPRGDFTLMKMLKNTFDTANVCAPGRLIGGL